MKIIEDLRKDYQEQINLNNETVRLNNEIMGTLSQENNVRGSCLSELNFRKKQRLGELQKLEGDIKILKEKEGELLIEMQNKYKATFDKLSDQRALLDNEMRELSEYQQRIELLRKKQADIEDLEGKIILLEEKDKRLRRNHAVLYNQTETYKDQIKKLEEQLKKQVTLSKRLEADKEIKKLWEEALIEVKIDRESKTISREV